MGNTQPAVKTRFSKRLGLWICIGMVTIPFSLRADQAPTVAEAQAFMDKAETELLDLGNMAQRAGWVEETYITGDTELLSAKEGERVIARTTELVNQSKRFDGLAMPPELKRKFMLLKLSLTMPAPDDPKLREQLTQIASSLDGSYGSGKYCPGGDKAKCVGIDQIDVQMAKSRDPKQLEDLWAGWHKVGAPMRDRYAKFVDLRIRERGRWASPTPAFSGGRTTT